MPAKSTGRKIRVEVKPITEGAVPDPQNANKHTQRGHALVENSIRRRGAFRSVASAGKGAARPVVMAGNLTLEKAIDAGITEIVNVHVDGHQLVNVVRDDLEPGSPEAIALGIEDNESAKRSYNPDIDMVAALAAGDRAVLGALRAEDKVLSGLLDQMLKDGGLFELVSEQDAFDRLPNGERPPYKQMTFILHDDQAAAVASAVRRAQEIGEQDTGSENENSNGNALAGICKRYLEVAGMPQAQEPGGGGDDAG